MNNELSVMERVHKLIPRESFRASQSVCDTALVKSILEKLIRENDALREQSLGREFFPATRTILYKLDQ